jgi:two-component system CheB/CheR fusion protein
LIVDDYLQAAESLALLLEASGYQTQVVHDGPAALNIVHEFHPDAALIDIGLPVMDGCELARRLRKSPGCEKISLIALTGYGQESDRQRVREAGFDEHVIKPVDPVRIGALINRIVGKAS